MIGPGPDLAMRILIIDDDIDSIGYLELYFQRAHHTLEWRTFIENEQSLRETLESFQPTGIVVDYEMPKHKGAEIYRWIRNWNDSVPVVFYSRYGESPEICLRMREAGASTQMTVTKSNAGRDAGRVLMLLERSEGQQEGRP